MTPQEVSIAIKVVPNATTNSIVGWENKELKIRLAAQPEKGVANEKLIAFLAKELKIAKQQIKLLSGSASRHKRLCLIDVNPKEVWFLKNILT